MRGIWWWVMVAAVLYACTYVLFSSLSLPT